MRYRSVGLGFLGLAEYLATHGMAYDSPEARAHVDEMFELFAFHTYKASALLAKERGTYELYKGSEYSRGILLGHDKAWFSSSATKLGSKWDEIFDLIAANGVRFAYHTAPAPNTSTAGVVGTTAALLPIYKKYFVETNLQLQRCVLLQNFLLKISGSTRNTYQWI